MKSSHLTSYVFAAFLTMLSLSSCHSSHKSAYSSVTIEDKYQKIADKIKKGTDKRSVVECALGWIGTPYSYGGNSRKGVDCSGFTYQVYKQAVNIKLPRKSTEQSEYCKKIKRKNLHPGDLVFFTNKRKGKHVNHVAIYIGDNQIIHSTTSAGVIVSDLNEKYWDSHFHHCGRIPNLND